MTVPRIAFSTLAFPDASLATAMSVGRDCGYGGAELRLVDGELIDPGMTAGARAKVRRTATFRRRDERAAGARRRLD
jgi:hypothetical protein